MNRKRKQELPHCGEILQTEFLELLDLSQSDLARAIGVPRARISDIVNGKRAITADTDLRLTKYFGLSEGYFLRIQERLDLLYARREIGRDLDRIELHPALADRKQEPFEKA